MNTRRITARLLAATAAAGVALVSFAGPASAHVSINPNTTSAGAFAVLTMSVPHGCDGSPTTKVAIQIPEEILSVTPTRNALWDVAKTKKKLAEPITDVHGNTVTERDAVVVYTAKTPLPDGIRDEFELSVQLPEKKGETLVFPTIQTCEKGQTAWTEVPAEGQDAHELESPAPAFTLTAAEAGHSDEAAASEASDEEDAATEDNAASTQASADDDSNTLGIAGLIAGVLGLLAGGAALMQVRRSV